MVRHSRTLHVWFNLWIVLLVITAMVISLFGDLLPLKIILCLINSLYVIIWFPFFSSEKLEMEHGILGLCPFKIRWRLNWWLEEYLLLTVSYPKTKFIFTFVADGNCLWEGAKATCLLSLVFHLEVQLFKYRLSTKFAGEEYEWTQRWLQLNWTFSGN